MYNKLVVYSSLGYDIVSND